MFFSFMNINTIYILINIMQCFTFLINDIKLSIFLFFIVIIIIFNIKSICIFAYINVNIFLHI